MRQNLEVAELMNVEVLARIALHRGSGKIIRSRPAMDATNCKLRSSHSAIFIWAPASLILTVH